MSKIYIPGSIENIRSRTNAYTSIVEAIVNSIDSVVESQRADGRIEVRFYREAVLDMPDMKGRVEKVEIYDNGIGFTENNTVHFDTFYSPHKKQEGGKGFGRFMFLKYFDQVEVESVFEEGGNFYKRRFSFGKHNHQIVSDNRRSPTYESDSETTISLNFAKKNTFFDKGLDVIARKLLERILIFFVHDNFICPRISIIEAGSGETIVLNEYLKKGGKIVPLPSKPFSLPSGQEGNEEKFTLKTFKVYSPKDQKSRICLAAHNREVRETPLHEYIPEFIDEFCEDGDGEESGRNYIIRAYITGDYLDSNVDLEREGFLFSHKRIAYNELPASEIEEAGANLLAETFATDLHSRSAKKVERVHRYVNDDAPWHKITARNANLSSLPYNANSEDIEIFLQTEKFHSELDARTELKTLLATGEFEGNGTLTELISTITENAKSDLVRYVCNRKLVLEYFGELMKRDEMGNAEFERSVHDVIFTRYKTDLDIGYEEHNLWLLDERLVFSEFIASDRQIGKTSDKKDRPDLVIFDKKKSFRLGDNEFSNPLTIFEFKRPKRTKYKEEDDPIRQIGRYLDQIRVGKYEMPNGVERIKVNDSTPVYAFIVADRCSRIDDFAKISSLSLSADEEGYFGYHSGFDMYIEIVSYKKLLKDANLRNKIFFSKLNI